MAEMRPTIVLDEVIPEPAVAAAWPQESMPPCRITEEARPALVRIDAAAFVPLCVLPVEAELAGGIAETRKRLEQGGRIERPSPRTDAPA